jgi:hypothetical protein
MEVFQRISTIWTQPPIGDRVVFRVGLVHRLIHRVVPRAPHELAALGQSLEKETVHPLGNEEDPDLRQMPMSPQISGFGLRPPSQRR